MEIKKLTDNVSVAGQIDISDISAIKNAGYNIIINNRPDGEAIDQPTNKQIEKATREAGLDYIYIPVGRDGISEEMIKQTNDLIKNNSSIFCYCRTGTRSTMLWALSQKGKISADDIISLAAKAGYDMAHLKDML